MPDIITLGIVELNSIAKGIQACDAMIKRSDVKLISAYPVCPGKYIIIINGDVAAVESSVQAGIDTAGTHFVDKMIIPRIHPQIIPGILGTSSDVNIEAVGVLETCSVASTILAADSSLKASQVNVIEIRIAKGLGGKAFYTLTGSISAVTSAIEAGILKVKNDGVIINKSIIPDPGEALKQQLKEW